MRTLKRIKQQKKKDFKNDFFTLDIETKNGLSPTQENFVFGCIYGHNYRVVLRSIDECYKELSRRRYRNKKIFAHNGEFDFSGIFGNIILNVDNSAIFNGKFISAKYRNTLLCDSMNVLPTSVKKLGDLLGLPKLDIDDEYLTGDNPQVTPKMIEYCLRDCEIIYNSLLNVFEMVGGVRITLASLSMYYFRKDFLKNDIIYNSLNEDFHECYYGGRTEAFKIGGVDARVYDINSLYPYVMTYLQFPDPKNLKKYDKPEIKYVEYIIKRKEGYFKGNIKHRETYVGYIPKRDDKTNKLLFPIGKFDCCVTFNELRFAIDNEAVELISCEYIVFSSPIDSPFKDFILSNYNQRLKTVNEFLKYFFKLIMNALYGRFGMKKKYTTTYYDIIPYELINELQEKKEYYELKLFSINRNDCYLITENKKADKMFFSIPSIAAYITSAARIELLKGILKNKDSLVYCDTDSIFIEKNPIGINIGKGLGEWKLEDKHICEVRGLKNYSILKNGNIEEIIKGVSKSSIQIERFSFKIEKYYKTKEAIRRAKPTGEKYITKKTITNKYDKRIVNSDGSTKPIKL